MTDHDVAGTPRSEYLARVHRVMDYVESHLDAPLDLDTLARVAHFSPFHFHRVFTGCTGETLYQFILRVRLERAATKVAQVPYASLTAIALDCGFGSSAAFSRAFRAAFGASATEWRRQLRKNRQTLSKEREELPGAGSYTASSGPGMAPEPDSRGEYDMDGNTSAKKAATGVRVEMLPRTTVAYVRHTGPYAGNEGLFMGLFNQLCAWAGPRGLIGPSARFLTIYHDNPEITSEDKLRISVAVTVPEDTRAEGGVGTMVLETGKYAVASFEIDASEYGAAWNWLMAEWMPASGYQPDDRYCFEMMLNDPGSHPEHKHIIEIWEPVRPL
jgi:AraC family transcriptional regulator